jgi:hypothetical protein
MEKRFDWLTVLWVRRVPAVLLVQLCERSEAVLRSRQRVRVHARAEVDARLALDERSRNLQNNRLDAVGAGPALFGEQLHADGPAAQHIPALDHGIDDPDERRLERKVLLEQEAEQDVVLVLLLLELLQVLVQSRVLVHLVELDVPLVEAVVHQLQAVHAVLVVLGFEDVAQLLHQPIIGGGRTK